MGAPVVLTADIQLLDVATPPDSRAAADQIGP